MGLASWEPELQNLSRQKCSAELSRIWAETEILAELSCCKKMCIISFSQLFMIFIIFYVHMSHLTLSTFVQRFYYRSHIPGSDEIMLSVKSCWLKASLHRPPISLTISLDQCAWWKQKQFRHSLPLDSSSFQCCFSVKSFLILVLS